ncbi:MAG TPA: hypothetical protein VIL77_02880 [Gaiellaceae bacterium]
MIDLPPDHVVDLPVDELARHVLRDLIKTHAFSAWNYINEAQQGMYRGPAAEAISGAIGWLLGQGLVARDPRNGGSSSAIVVTPAGRRVAGA